MKEKGEYSVEVPEDWKKKADEIMSNCDENQLQYMQECIDKCRDKMSPSTDVPKEYSTEGMPE